MEHCKLIIIAAVSVDGVIGTDNKIPWRIPEDFKHFRDTTMGNMLLIGYNTYLNLPEKAFEGREYIVINSGERFNNSRVEIYQFSNLRDILHVLNSVNNDVEKIFIAGGAMIYESLIDDCDEVIITWVNKTYPDGNKRFPVDKLFANFEVYNDQDWQTSKTGIQYKITYYKRKS